MCIQIRNFTNEINYASLKEKGMGIFAAAPLIS